MAFYLMGSRDTKRHKSHEQHEHKDKINTKTKHDISSETCEDKTSKIFHCFTFCSAFGLCLDYTIQYNNLLDTPRNGAFQ